MCGGSTEKLIACNMSIPDYYKKQTLYGLIKQINKNNRKLKQQTP